jgi:sporulation protein YlmC with PRC-barrel domain
MLWTASGIKGYAILASDGKIGTVADFLFDDDSWLVRWLVVDTGTWLTGRKVLLPPFVLGHADPAKREFSVKMTMAQVKDSPDVDTERSVSRQMESNVYEYYGWRPYWGTGFYMGSYGYSGDAWTGVPPLGSRRPEGEAASNQRDNDDPHLRSVQAVTGYHINATDGEIGHVEDLLVDDADWSIHYFVVDTKNWWPAKKVLISPASAHDINWSDRLVNLDVDRQQVKSSPEYDELATIDQNYERRYRDHYGAGVIDLP